MVRRGLHADLEALPQCVAPVANGIEARPLLVELLWGSGQAPRVLVNGAVALEELYRGLTSATLLNQSVPCAVPELCGIKMPSFS